MLPVSCSICHLPSNIHHHLSYDHVSREAFRIKVCPVCDLLFVDPCPTYSELGRYYFNQNGHQSEDDPGRLFKLMRELSFQFEGKNFLPYFPPETTVLDFGSGDGAFAKFCHDSGYYVHAVDVLSESSWAFEEISYNKIDFSRINSELLRDLLMSLKPIPTAAVLRHVLEHLIEPHEIIKVFKDVGIKKIYTVVPNRESILSKIFGDYWYYWEPPRHLTHFHRRSLRQFYEHLGYRTISEGYYGLDEIICSVHRLISLTQPDWTTLKSITEPRSTLAGISSALSRRILKTVCWSTVALD